MIECYYGLHDFSYIELDQKSVVDQRGTFIKNGNIILSRDHLKCTFYVHIKWQHKLNKTDQDHPLDAVNFRNHEITFNILNRVSLPPRVGMKSEQLWLIFNLYSISRQFICSLLYLFVGSC